MLRKEIQNGMELDFSVIIPVYNTEDNVIRCMESLKKQKGCSFEVIVIDDGSTDASGELCDQFAEKNEEFKVYHCKNQGPSAARNLGLQLAKGKYVAFVDSDDYVEDNYFKIIENGFKKLDVDILFIGYTECFDNERQKVRYIPEQKNVNFYEMIMSLDENKLFGYTWGKVFKRSVVQNYKFCEKLNLFEDEIFICNVLKYCHSIGIINDTVYFYVHGDRDALTKKVYQNYFYMKDRVYISWLELFDKYEYRDAILKRKANTFVMTSQYYIYEQKVVVPQFVEMLQNCLFFQHSTLKNSFCEAVRKNAYYKIYIMRWKYRLKLKLYQVLSRKEK